jgi:hypothetical protein
MNRTSPLTPEVLYKNPYIDCTLHCKTAPLSSYPSQFGEDEIPDVIAWYGYPGMDLNRPSKKIKEKRIMRCRSILAGFIFLSLFCSMFLLSQIVWAASSTEKVAYPHKRDISITLFTDYVSFSNPNNGEAGDKYSDLFSNDTGVGASLEVCKYTSDLFEVGAGLSLLNTEMNHQFFKPAGRNFEITTQFTKIYMLSRLSLTDALYLKFLAGTVIASNLAPGDSEDYEFLYGMGLGARLRINEYVTVMAEVCMENSSLESSMGDDISFVPIKVGCRWNF